MIGLSLSYKWLLGDHGTLESPETFLPQLWERGVRSIEIRTVPAGADADEVLRASEPLLKYGFNITVHAKVKTVENAVDEVLRPLSLLVEKMSQKELIVTVHPILGDNVAMLCTLSDCIVENGYPVRIALENERKMPDKTEGNSLSLVLEAVTRADRANVGICFDMGHFAWYNEEYSLFPNQLPPKEFLLRVIHTHIHACEDGVTHHPLTVWRSPFSDYIEALSFGYFGVYNLEIEPERFADKFEKAEALLISVDTLRADLPVCAALYEDIKLNYDTRFQNAVKILNEKDGCRMALIAPSSYIFSTGGYRWAMDVAFRNIGVLAKTPLRIKEYLGDIDLMVLTHGHEDHFEESTVRALADTDITWLVPEFMVDDVTALGVQKEKIVVATVGERYTVGPLCFKVLEGRHFRPVTGNGVQAVGYYVEADGMPSLAFPGDVRDYGTEGLEEMDADYCFAHLWLTDEACDPTEYIPKSDEFAEFMLLRSRRNIVIAHLYESGRKVDGMWQLHHAEIARSAIKKRSPETNVTVPAIGDIIELI